MNINTIQGISLVAVAILAYLPVSSWISTIIILINAVILLTK